MKRSERNKGVSLVDVNITDSTHDRFMSKVDKNGPQPDTDTPHYVGLSKCWTWTAAFRRDGYGVFGFGGSMKAAHRVSHQLHVGDVPEGMCVLHKCDNKKCVNPDHLTLGTLKDNHRDMRSKGREARGDTHGMRLHPERVARGDNHYSKRNPELCARGSRHGTVTRPERIARGERHGSKTCPENTPRGERCWNSKLTEDIVRTIRSRWSLGDITQTSLAKEFGISFQSVSNIVRRKIWKHVT